MTSASQFHAFRSAIYDGKVMHRRVSPKRHRFVYRVASWLIDLGELGQLDRSQRFFSWNRFNLFSLHDRDFGRGDGSSIAEHVRALLREEQLPEPARIELLCYPRLLGYAFNPIAIYFCYDRDDRVMAVLHEVTNTFGDRHTYIADARRGDNPSPGDEVIRHSADKRLHVSPFLPMQGRYHFRLRRPDAQLQVGIRETRDGQPVLTAVLSGDRKTISSAALLSQFLAMPLMTLKVTAGIHWEALKLWLKGLTVYRRPEPGHGVSRADDQSAIN